MTAANTSLSSKPLHNRGSSVAAADPDPAGSRSRGSAGRRDAILDAALAIARTGGYDAVHMRTVAERVGIAVGTLYRYYPAKTHLLVAALTREFQRLDVAGDWTGGPGTPTQRLNRLTTHLHERWQRDPLLTDAMTRAFAMADTRAATELDLAAATITTLLARTLSAGEPTPAHLHVASIISDIWLANLLAVISGRLSAADARDRIDGATRRVVDRATRHLQTP